MRVLWNCGRVLRTGTSPAGRVDSPWTTLTRCPPPVHTLAPLAHNPTGPTTDHSREQPDNPCATKPDSSICCQQRTHHRHTRPHVNAAGQRIRVRCTSLRGALVRKPMDSRLRGNDGSCRNHNRVDGIIPAFAGMTEEGLREIAVRTIIPAVAGMTEEGLREIAVRTIIPAVAGMTALAQSRSFPRRRESIRPIRTRMRASAVTAGTAQSSANGSRMLSRPAGPVTPDPLHRRWHAYALSAAIAAWYASRPTRRFQ